jgi:putative ABC transport system ATP-binding protein
VASLQAIAAAGTTVVVITHDHELAATFDRQISLLDGEVVSDDAGTQAVPPARPAGPTPWEQTEPVPPPAGPTQWWETQ